MTSHERRRSPIVGFRRWSFRFTGLTGSYGTVWRSPELRAECSILSRPNPYRQIPHTDSECNRCGIYAYANAEWLLPRPPLQHPRLLRHVLPFAHIGGQRAGPTVYGAVSLSGKIVEHQHGYRASHARVIAVALAAGPAYLEFTTPAAIASLFTDPLCVLPDYFSAELASRHEGAHDNDQRLAAFLHRFETR